MTEEIFVFCGWRFSNQLDIVSETHFSCDTVDRGLWLAILSSLLCPETEGTFASENKVMYFMFWCFIPDINQCVNSYFETGKIFK